MNTDSKWSQFCAISQIVKCITFYNQFFFQLPDGKTQLWLTFQKVQYTFNEDTRRFQALEFDNNKSMKYFQDYKGIQTEEELTETKMEYGNNR